MKINTELTAPIKHIVKYKLYILFNLFFGETGKTPIRNDDNIKSKILIKSEDMIDTLAQDNAIKLTNEHIINIVLAA